MQKSFNNFCVVHYKSADPGKPGSAGKGLLLRLMEWNNTESSNLNENASTSGQNLPSTSNLNHSLPPESSNIGPNPNQAVPQDQQTSLRDQFDIAAGRGNVSHSQQFRHQLSRNTRPTYSYAFQQLYAAMNPAEIGRPQGIHPQSFYPRNITAFGWNQQSHAINPTQIGNQQNNPPSMLNQLQPMSHQATLQSAAQSSCMEVPVSSVPPEFIGSVLKNCTFNIAGRDINTTGTITQTQGTSDGCSIDLHTVSNCLKSSARKQCSSKNFLKLTKQNIEICQMEITNKLSRKIKPAKYQTLHGKLLHPSLYNKHNGHYNRRKDYEKINLKEESKVSVECLFHLAKQQASESNDPECSGNVVALIGQPGIGKTTLSKVITENILEDKMESIANYEWVFYISIKSINFENPVKLVDFLLKYSLDNTQYNKLSGKETPDLQEALLKELFKSTNVFIAFDGLDEASTNWDLEYKGGLDWREKNNPLLYLLGLMKGDILPEAKKLFTSRQNHFFSIDQNCRPPFVAEVLGLNTKSRESLCKQICPDHKDEVWQIIESNPNLSYSCYVPAKCIFIVYSIWKSLKEHSGERFHSLTHVFGYGFKYYFADGFVKGTAKDEKYMDKIANLAWNGFKQKKIVFEEMDLGAVGIDLKTFIDVLSAFVTEENWDMKILDCDRKSNFSHLIWQEYFAACYLVYFASVDEFCKLIPEFASDRWEVVAKFVFGLFNSEVTKVAKTCFTTTNQNEQEFQEKKAKLFELACDEMKVCAEGTDKKSRNKLVQVCSWLQEIDDDKFYHGVSSFLPRSVVLDGNILLTDVSSITEVLSRSQTNHDINISKTCRFPHGSLQVFFQNLTKHNIQIKLLNLGGMSLTVEEATAISLYIHNIKELDLNYCRLTNDIVRKIANTISNLSQPMKSLYFCGSKVTDESASAIASCIHNIRQLFLESCHLTSFGICEIAKAISNLPQLIKLLNLHGNKVTDESASAIASCIHNIKELNLWDCNLTSLGISKITKAILNLSQPIKSLNLRSNKVTDESASAIAFCIHNIEKLDLEDCQPTIVGICEIAKAISNLSQPINSLNLGKNKVTDESASAIASCIHNIGKLSLWDCELTSFGICEIAKAISNLSQPMKSLNLRFSLVTDENASAIASCVHNIEELDLKFCELTVVGICEITKAISNLSQPMRKLDLFGITIYEEVEKNLFGCLHNIQDELTVRNSCISADFESKYSKLPEPKPKLTFDARLI